MNLLIRNVVFFVNVLLFFDCILTKKFDYILNTSLIENNHGYLIGYFTFTGKGLAGLSYHITPFENSSNFQLVIFPMAYDTYSNLKRITNYYFQASCKEFYQKSIFTVNIDKISNKVPLGRFSGGFAVAIILSNKYACPPNLRKLDFHEKPRPDIIKAEIELFNPDGNDNFSNHLSATDHGVKETFQILMALFVGMACWAVYSVNCNSNIDIPLMVIIQKLTCIIILLHIIINGLMLVAYNRLSQYGVNYKEVELVCELLALISRYMEIYIVISWTLSSQRDSGRSSRMLAQIFGGCAVLHTMATAAHYAILNENNIGFGCSVIWDCESHLYSLGFGNPLRYNATSVGYILVLLNWIAGLGTSIFVLHLLKLGLGMTDFSVRRAYVSVFCSASLLWFWSYPVLWMLSGLITEYYQYKFVLFTVSVAHVSAIPAILRVTLISSVANESSSPEFVAVHE